MRLFVLAPAFASLVALGSCDGFMNASGGAAKHWAAI